MLDCLKPPFVSWPDRAVRSPFPSVLLLWIIRHTAKEKLALTNIRGHGPREVGRLHVSKPCLRSHRGGFSQVMMLQRLLRFETVSKHFHKPSRARTYRTTKRRKLYDPCALE